MADIAAKNGRLLLGRSGGLRSSCYSTCTVQLTQYTYSPCTPDAGGANNWHRGLMLYPHASALDVTKAEPPLGWSYMSGNVTSFSWPYTSDGNVISVAKSLPAQSSSAGCATATLGGSNGEIVTISGHGAAWLENYPCCDFTCSNRNSSGHFYYKVTISGGCGKAYCFWTYKSEGTPTEFNRDNGTVRIGNVVWSPDYTFQGTGTHPIDRSWSGSLGTVEKGPGLLVVFLA